MAKKVTMQVIADHLGVSKFVVSKALSGKGGVSESTKEKVMKTASQLGYFSQSKNHMKMPAASSSLNELNAGKQSVVVLMPNIRFQNIDSEYWGRVLDGISMKLEEYGLRIIVITEQSNDQLLSILNPQGILGLIGVGVLSTPMLLEIHRLNLPFVLVDHEDSLIPSDTIFANNYDSMYRLTKHFIGIGHKKLQFVGNVHYSRSFYDRWLGFRGALEEAGLLYGSKDPLLLMMEGVDSFKDQLREAIRQQRKSKDMPTAYVCANDQLAMDLLEVLHELDVNIPEDVSVSGFDNIEKSLQFTPALTTVDVPKAVLGQRAVEKLRERIGRKEAPHEKTLVSCKLIYRESTSNMNMVV